MRTLRERVPTAEQYYRVTGDSFRALCPDTSGHMNMGLWPATTLREGQERLVRFALERARARAREPRGILDLGSGWGASRAIFHEVFPHTPYYGVNVSPGQVAVARQVTAHLPHTEYVVGRAEDRDLLPWDRADLLFSIEAAFHFEDKASLLREAAARGVRLVTLFEICVEDPRVVKDALLSPSLRSAWSVKQYEEAFAASGFARPSADDVGAHVFPGFLDYIESIDDRTYQGRRAVLDQLRRATRAIAAAASLGEIRYVLLQAEAR